MARDAAQDEQVRQHVDDVRRVQASADPDREAFSRELVDDVEHADFPFVTRAILDEVVGPYVVGVFRPYPQA